VSYDHPLKWLLYELPAYIEPAPLAALMERYEANKRGYARQSKIAQIERIIKLYEKRDNPRDADFLATKRAKLKQLKETTL
jgi:hypothetical protein